MATIAPFHLKPSAGGAAAARAFRRGLRLGLGSGDDELAELVGNRVELGLRGLLGLGEAVDRAQFHGADRDLGALLGQRREHDDRHRPRLHQLLEEIDAVHAGHFDVECDDVGLELRDHLARLVRIGGAVENDDVAGLLQRSREQGAHSDRVVDDQNAGFLGHEE